MLERTKKYLSWLLILAMICALFSAISLVAYAEQTAPPSYATGYDSADDVVYKYDTVGGKTYTLNWGAQGELCVFLSSKASEFYTGEYVFSDMSQSAGGVDEDDIPSSQLYLELHTLMYDRHTYITNFEETKNLYKYTDCEKNDSTMIYLFYCGQKYASEWEKGGYNWNREHIWPNIKSLTSNTEKNDSADIMTLRPVHSSENSSRSDKAYGSSTTSDYFFPGDAVKGDCARALLYHATRWGGMDRLFGASGVIESVEVLFEWMEEDPVDTWEMGRNDAVQSITGTRNVFVDYPEYAWLLFGRELPDNYDTPSDNSGVVTWQTREEESTEIEPPMPDIDGEKYTYLFSKYPSGAAYGKNEVHVLDDILTLKTDDAYFSDQLRLYNNKNNKSTAIFESDRYINALSVNAGNEVDTLKISASRDGVNWIKLKDVSLTVKYNDYNIEIADGEYCYLLFESTSKPLRVASVTLIYGDGVGSLDGTDGEGSSESEEMSASEETSALEEASTAEEDSTLEESSAEEVSSEAAEESGNEAFESSSEQLSEAESGDEVYTQDENRGDEIYTQEENRGDEIYTQEENRGDEIYTQEENRGDGNAGEVGEKDSGAESGTADSESESGGGNSAKKGCGSSLGGGFTVMIFASSAGLYICRKKKNE